jgi:hypothetical protein
MGLGLAPGWWQRRRSGVVLGRRGGHALAKPVGRFAAVDVGQLVRADVASLPRALGDGEVRELELLRCLEKVLER